MNFLENANPLALMFAAVVVVGATGAVIGGAVVLCLERLDRINLEQLTS